MAELTPTPIAELESGRRVMVRGRVRAAQRLLSSGLSERPCVYWDCREGYRDSPERQAVQDFWLEDGSGKLLVRAEVGSITVAVRGERQDDLVDVATTDIEVVSHRIRELKEAIRAGGGRELIQERKRLAKIATVLCAIRAQAKGNVHVGGNLARQSIWIDKHRDLIEDAESNFGKATVQMMVQRWEVLIEPDDEITLVGLCQTEPLPSAYGASGYRDQSTCMTLRAADGEVLEAFGVGASAPLPPEDAPPSTSAFKGHRAPRAQKTSKKNKPLVDPILLATILLVGLAVYWLYK